MKGTRGQKKLNKIFINNSPELKKGDLYAEDNITLQLFTDDPNVILFPQDSKNPFIIKPNSTEQKNFFLYPKKEQSNSAIINCVDVYNRNIYKSWYINYEVLFPEFDETERIKVKDENQFVVNYSYKNPTKNFMVLSFYSSNSDVLEIIDRVETFEGEKSKDIKLKVHKSNSRKEEVLMFVSDDNSKFCKTILFEIIETN